MRWPGVILLVLFSVLLLLSPATAGGRMLAAAPSSGPRAAGLAIDAIPLPPSSSPSPLPSTTPVSLTFTLTNPHSEELAQFLAGVQDPGSSAYRHFVTYAEYLARFAPPASQVGQVEATLAGAGARDIEATPDRSSVLAVLPARSVDQLLDISLLSYGSSGRMPLYTSVGSPELPPSLTGLISGVSGLSDLATAEVSAEMTATSLHPEPLSERSSQFVHDNKSGENWFVGSDYAQAYDATALFPGNQSVPNATYPRTVAIATLLASSYNVTTQTDLPPWDPAVIDSYFNGTYASDWPKPNLTGVPVVVNGVTPPLPGSLGSLNDSTLYEAENSLDLEMAGSLAPGASLYNFYFAGSQLVGGATVGNAANYVAEDLAEALAYDYAPAHLATVSISLGLPDLNDSAWNAELLTAAATGVTILSASGDQGDAPNSLTNRGTGPWPTWPATAATNVSGAVSVGGVTLSLSGRPNVYFNESALNLSYDPDAGTISSVAAWWDTDGGPGYYAGTEGGVSSVYPEPYWQFHSAAQWPIVNATELQGATALGRSVPDLAMPANSTIATIFANSTGTVFFTILEGTSIAAPVLAGLLADVVAVENNGSSHPWSSLGFIGPEIYRIASYFAAFPSAGGDPFEDVTTGCNYVFCAAPGWSATTGWGGVNASRFLSADENSTLVNYVYTGPTPVLPPPPPPAPVTPVPWTLIYAVFGVGIVVAIALVVVSARPSRPSPGGSTVPWGAQSGGAAYPRAPPPPGTYLGATFLCPYCGAIRPSEPVRCPQCGAF